jgi:high-affinity iron transporter
VLIPAISVTGVAVLIAAGSLVLAAPSAPSPASQLSAGSINAELLSVNGTTAVVRTAQLHPAGGNQHSAAAASEITVRKVDQVTRNGVTTDRYLATVPGSATSTRPARLPVEQVAALNGGRLPLGLRGANAATDVAVKYADADVLTLWVEPRTSNLVDLRWDETVHVTAVGTLIGAVPLAKPIATASTSLPAGAAAAAASAARSDVQALDHRQQMHAAAWACVGLAVVAAVALIALLATGRPPSRRRVEAPERPSVLARS